ncbi:MAG: 4Fe-4S dicluster domain-containing protein [Candidatus Jordarchaeales archaeon]
MVKLTVKVSIEWFEDKCPEPQNCGKCLEVCPCTVFVRYATDREPNKEPTHYRIVPSFQRFCIACYKCVEACPRGAIRINVSET